MSRTDKDRPFWVISNDPYARRQLIFEHSCGHWGFYSSSTYQDCTLGEPRERSDRSFNHCGYSDAREVYWYEGYESDTRRQRAKERARTHDAISEFNTAFRQGNFDEVAEDYDYPDDGSRDYDLIW